VFVWVWNRQIYYIDTPAAVDRAHCPLHILPSDVWRERLSLVGGHDLALYADQCTRVLAILLLITQLLQIAMVMVRLIIV